MFDHMQVLCEELASVLALVVNLYPHAIFSSLSSHFLLEKLAKWFMDAKHFSVCKTSV